MTPEQERSRRIERQHSQEMALRFLELQFKVDPDAFSTLYGSEDLIDVVEDFTDVFANDLILKEVR